MSINLLILLAGEFPSRYRPLIWRFLMKLPENTVAFSDLGKVTVYFHRDRSSAQP